MAGLLRGNLSEYFVLAPATDKLPSVGRSSEYSSDDLVSIRIKAAAMAEHNSLRLPRVDLSDRRLSLSSLDE